MIEKPSQCQTLNHIEKVGQVPLVVLFTSKIKNLRVDTKVRANILTNQKNYR